MINITLPSIPDFDAWRLQARACLAANLHPSKLTWNAPEELFAHDAPPPPAPLAIMNLPRAFIEQAKLAVCHRDRARYALLYRMIWRLTHTDKNLMRWTTDDDVLALTAMVKAVRRDTYKIKAFLRFREAAEKGHFIAWYEPEHFTLELALPFFTTRFANMRWSILTPYRAAHWDGEEATLQEAPDRAAHPTEDKIEAYWLTYYGTTFNPARIKKKAMLAQMPKKYWKNMPETALVEPMLKAAHARVQNMLENSRDDFDPTWQARKTR